MNCSLISSQTISLVLSHLTTTFTIFHKQNSLSQTRQCCYRREHSLPSLISNLLRVRPGTGFDWHSSCKRQLYCSFHFTASRFETLFSSKRFSFLSCLFIFSTTECDSVCNIFKFFHTFHYESKFHLQRYHQMSSYITNNIIYLLL